MRRAWNEGIGGPPDCKLAACGSGVSLEPLRRRSIHSDEHGVDQLAWIIRYKFVSLAAEMQLGADDFHP